jgi:hypothetical protein
LRENGEDFVFVESEGIYTLVNDKLAGGKLRVMQEVPGFSRRQAKLLVFPGHQRLPAKGEARKNQSSRPRKAAR